MTRNIYENVHRNICQTIVV